MCFGEMTLSYPVEPVESGLVMVDWKASSHDTVKAGAEHKVLCAEQSSEQMLIVDSVWLTAIPAIQKLFAEGWRLVAQKHLEPET